jgi:hypothetical protein
LLSFCTVLFGGTFVVLMHFICVHCEILVQNCSLVWALF